MKRLFSFLTFFTLFFSFPSWAVDCYQNFYDGPVSTTLTLPSFAVPNDIQLGEKIWESSDINITVYCNNASGWTSSNTTEDIYAWIMLSAFNSSDVLNSPYFTFGVTYNGVDHEGINEGVNLGVCLDKYESVYGQTYHYPVCNGVYLQKSKSFNARFRLYVKITPPLIQFITSVTSTLCNLTARGEQIY